MTAQIFKEIAAVMDADPAMVAEVVRISKEHGILYRGSKRHGDVIFSEGVRPLTPEGGPGSFWAKGLSLFTSNPSGLGGMDTYDTPFFNYAHGSLGSRLAITDEGTLARYGITRRDTPPDVQDGQVVLRQLVPAGAIDIIDMVSKARKLAVASPGAVAMLEQTPREYGQYRERILLETLYEHLKNYGAQRGARISRLI